MARPFGPRLALLAAGARPLARRNPAFTAMFALGVLLRVVLAPLWHGQDFTVWSLASAATLHGSDIYAHHPAYPAGPFAYLPLFVYVETPFRYLADVTGLSFTVLGKLPTLLADCGVAGLLYAAALRLGCRRGVATAASAAYFLNPLVLYNSAYYGRFDSIGCLLLLASTTRAATYRVDVRAAIWYALAIAAKTFPIFVLPTLLRAAGRRHRAVVMLVVVTVPLLLCLPYLSTPGALIHDTVVYDGLKTPQGASWWAALPAVRVTTNLRLSDVGWVVFVIGAVVIAQRLAVRSPDHAVAATLVLFLACNKVVLEQYLTWPLPWLALALCASQPLIRYATAVLIVALTALALLDTESFHPFGRTSEPIGAAIAAVCAAYVIVVLIDDRGAVRRRAGVARPGAVQPIMRGAG